MRLTTDSTTPALALLPLVLVLVLTMELLLTMVMVMVVVVAVVVAPAASVVRVAKLLKDALCPQVEKEAPQVEEEGALLLLDWMWPQRSLLTPTPLPSLLLPLLCGQVRRVGRGVGVRRVNGFAQVQGRGAILWLQCSEVVGSEGVLSRRREKEEGMLSRRRGGVLSPHG